MSASELVVNVIRKLASYLNDEGALRGNYVRLVEDALNHGGTETNGGPPIVGASVPTETGNIETDEDTLRALSLPAAPAPADEGAEEDRDVRYLRGCAESDRIQAAMARAEENEQMAVAYETRAAELNRIASRFARRLSGGARDSTESSNDQATADAPRSGHPATGNAGSTPVSVDAILNQLEDALAHHADQPLHADFMGLRRAWRGILRPLVPAHGADGPAGDEVAAGGVEHRAASGTGGEHGKSPVGCPESNTEPLGEPAVRTGRPTLEDVSDLVRSLNTAHQRVRELEAALRELKPLNDLTAELKDLAERDTARGERLAAMEIEELRAELTQERERVAGLEGALRGISNAILDQEIGKITVNDAYERMRDAARAVLLHHGTPK